MATSASCSCICNERQSGRPTASGPPCTHGHISAYHSHHLRSLPWRGAPGPAAYGPQVPTQGMFHTACSGSRRCLTLLRIHCSSCKQGLETRTHTHTLACACRSEHSAATRASGTPHPFCLPEAWFGRARLRSLAAAAHATLTAEAAGRLSPLGLRQAERASRACCARAAGARPSQALPVARAHRRRCPRRAPSAGAACGARPPPRPRAPHSTALPPPARRGAAARSHHLRRTNPRRLRRPRAGAWLPPRPRLPGRGRRGRPGAGHCPAAAPPPQPMNSQMYSRSYANVGSVTAPSACSSLARSAGAQRWLSCARARGRVGRAAARRPPPRAGRAALIMHHRHSSQATGAPPPRSGRLCAALPAAAMAQPPGARAHAGEEASSAALRRTAARIRSKAVPTGRSPVGRARAGRADAVEGRAAAWQGAPACSTSPRSCPAW